ncbi:MAG: DUF1805 domain-containing protein [Candidatus Saelkia tenebricola]|nr:DUF1805 domain-containing protein [Candidatus Saelkia tenebricola]
MTVKCREIKVGKKNIEAILINLASKNLIVLRGECGYIMCGYLDLKVADKFEDVAVKITGVASIEDALNSEVASLSHSAEKLGMYIGQPIKEVLKIIA